MGLVVGLTNENEIVLQTGDGEIVIRYARRDENGLPRLWIAAPEAVSIKRRSKGGGNP